MQFEKKKKRNLAGTRVHVDDQNPARFPYKDFSVCARVCVCGLNEQTCTDTEFRTRGMWQCLLV